MGVYHLDLSEERHWSRLEIAKKNVLMGIEMEKMKKRKKIPKKWELCEYL